MPQTQPWEGPLLGAGRRPLSRVVTPITRPAPADADDEEALSSDDENPPPPRAALPPAEDDGPVIRGAAAGLLLSFFAAALAPTLLPGVAARAVLLGALAAAVLLASSFLAVGPLFRRLPLWLLVFLACACMGGLVGGVVGDAVSALPAMAALRRALPWARRFA